MLSRSEAEAELIRFVNNEYTALLQALEGMAERNEETAELARLDDDRIHVELFTESAANWRQKAEELRERWLALPEESLE